MADKTLGQIAFEAGEAGVWSFANHKRWERIANAVVEAARGQDLQSAYRSMKDAQQPAPEAQPNDWRLPHDLKAGHVTFRQGVHCRSLVARMEYLYSEAFPGIAELTDAQRAENLAALQAMAQEQSK